MCSLLKILSTSASIRSSAINLIKTQIKKTQADINSNIYCGIFVQCPIDFCSFCPIKFCPIVQSEILELNEKVGSLHFLLPQGKPQMVSPGEEPTPNLIQRDNSLSAFPCFISNILLPNSAETISKLPSNPFHVYDAPDIVSSCKCKPCKNSPRIAHRKET